MGNSKTAGRRGSSSGKSRLSVAFRALLAALISLALLPALPAAAFAEETRGAADQGVTYSQENGYEPYLGWQNAMWDQFSDPDYAGGTGGAANGRKGWPAWSLIGPLSIGVTKWDVSSNAMTTGDAVTVVTDTAACDTSGVPTKDDPWYYKNIILEPYDLSSGSISFDLTYIGAGGAAMNPTDMLSDGGGFLVSTSSDPADWQDPSKVLWRAVEGDIVTGTAGAGAANWWRNVTVTVPADVMRANETYYFAITNNIKGGHAHFAGNIVFEFSTGSATSSWVGDVSAAGALREQGNGGTKVGFIDPAPEALSVDLTKAADCWYDLLSTEVSLGGEGDVSFTVHSDGSGSNHQVIADWNSIVPGKVFVFDADPCASGSFDISNMTPVASHDLGNLTHELANPDRDWPTYDGVKLTASGLEAGKTYYLVFTDEFRPGASQTQSLMKPLVLRFSTKAAALANSWDVSKAGDGSLMASLSDDGVLTVTGAGEMADYAQGAVPWGAQAAARIQKVLVNEGATTVGSHAFSNLPALASVKLPASLVSVGEGAFRESAAVVAVDASACASLTTVGAGAFRFSEDAAAKGSSVYLPDADKVALIDGSGQADLDASAGVVRSNTAVVVLNGGAFAADAVFESSKLVQPVKEDHTFVTWTSDKDLMHPTSAWMPLSSGVLYAKFSKNQIIEEPVPYPGQQGLDQQVRLLDVAKLPSSETATNVKFYGESETAYDNRFDTAFNGYNPIEFAYVMSRGTNANGGNGDYQLSFSLPYVSILNDKGDVVASYDDGNGLLKKYAVYFNGKEAQSGYTITAVKIGVDAGVLPAGDYTLRFGKDFGSNNGISFLGKNVDFKFTVDYAEQFKLTYDFNDADKTAVVTGYELMSDRAVDVVVPATVSKPGVDTPCQVTAVAAGAFDPKKNAAQGAGSIVSVELPASVASIGDGAFANMDALGWVKVLAQGDAAVPAWGKDVFAGTCDCTLYGYLSSSAKAAADQYGNVTFGALDDGIYVNGVAVSDGDVIALNAAAPNAEVRVMKDGDFATDQFRGFITNTNVATHPGTTPYTWSTLTGVANGEAQLVVRTVDGADYAELTIKAEGFAQDASSDPVPLNSAQGNGATVMLLEAGDIVTYSFDETRDFFDNRLLEPIGVEDAVFSLAMGGPGSAWGPSHSGWKWNEFRAQAEKNLWLENAQGQVIATIGDGLSWVTLDTTNTLRIAVAPDRLTVGETYVLVASKNLTGHNVAAKLMKEARWQFTAGSTDLSAFTVTDIEDQVWDGLPMQPEVTVSQPGMDVSIWNEDAKKTEVTPGQPRALTADKDFTVEFANNNAVGEATATVKGAGTYAGEITKTFRVTAPALNLVALKQAVADAQAAKEGVASSADGKDVADGGKWATPGDFQTLNLAIAEAESVVAKAEALLATPALVADGQVAPGYVSQVDVDAATAAMQSSTESFSLAVRIARVDRAAAEQLAVDAEAFKATLKVSEDGGELAPGVAWVTSANMEVLQTMVDDAKALAAKSDVSQDSLDEALAVLKTGFETFKNDSVNTSNPSDVQLVIRISQVKAGLDKVQVAQDDRDLTNGTMWAKPAAADVLKAVVAEAQAVVDKTSATQDEIDAALAKLAAAEDAFYANDVKMVVVDVAALEEAIKTASAERALVVESKDGKDVYATEKWASPEALAAADDAIAAAQAALADPKKTRATIDQAVADLKAAGEAFAAAQQNGFKLDPRALETAVGAAQAKIDAAVIDADAANVDVGTMWVTQDAVDAFQAVVDDARALLGRVAGDGGAAGDPATQDDIDAMLLKLAEADGAFDAAAQPGTKAHEDTEPDGGSDAGGTGAGNAGGTGSSSGAGSDKGSAAIPATGDNAPVAPMLIALIAAVVALAAVRRASKCR